MKIIEYIHQVIKKTNAQGVDPNKTNDRIIIGDSSQILTGVASTYMPTIDVIQKAIDQKCNLIIAHEPTWYNGQDISDWLENDETYIYKKNLIETHNIVIWRYHDYMHFAPKDLIYKGFEYYLGWEKYNVTGDKTSDNPLENADLIYEIPKTNLDSLMKLMQKKLNINSMRYIGAKTNSVKRIGVLLGGSALGLGDEKNPIKLLMRYDLDTIITGDIIEWTIPTYIKDTNNHQRNLSLIALTHKDSEEMGMKYIVSFLKDISNEVPVYYIGSDDLFKNY